MLPSDRLPGAFTVCRQNSYFQAIKVNRSREAFHYLLDKGMVPLPKVLSRKKVQIDTFHGQGLFTDLQEMA